METLKNSLHNAQLTEEEKEEINKRLLVMLQLSSLQQNLASEIEWKLAEKCKYKLTIKHNHERIKSLIRQNISSGFWGILTPKQTDVICQDADDIERIVKQWAGIKL